MTEERQLPEGDRPVDAPELHPVHAHAAGHRWFDYVMGGAALLVSVVSLYVALHHGRTMEKLVQASSFPNLEPDLDIADGSQTGHATFSVLLRNSGVGPARIETLALSADGVPLASLGELVSAIVKRSGQTKFSAKLSVESAVGSLVGAGRELRLVSFDFPDAAVWYAPALATAEKLSIQVCYCSVFDECFTVESGKRPARVRECVKPKVPFQDDSIEMLKGAGASAASAVVK
jgi:hypothetical protein